MQEHLGGGERDQKRDFWNIKTEKFVVIGVVHTLGKLSGAHL